MVRLGSDGPDFYIASAVGAHCNRSCSISVGAIAAGNAVKDEAERRV
jgi:hypothetical protein